MSKETMNKNQYQFISQRGGLVLILLLCSLYSTVSANELTPPVQAPLADFISQV